MDNSVTSSTSGDGTISAILSLRTLHGLVPIPSSATKRRVQKACKICRSEGRRKDTRTMCIGCKDQPGLCSEEHFIQWHVQQLRIAKRLNALNDDDGFCDKVLEFNDAIENEKEAIRKAHETLQSLKNDSFAPSAAARDSSQVNHKMPGDTIRKKLTLSSGKSKQQDPIKKRKPIMSSTSRLSYVSNSSSHRLVPLKLDTHQRRRCTVCLQRKPEQHLPVCRRYCPSCSQFFCSVKHFRNYHKQCKINVGQLRAKVNYGESSKVIRVLKATNKTNQQLTKENEKFMRDVGVLQSLLNEVKAAVTQHHNSKITKTLQCEVSGESMIPSLIDDDMSARDDLGATHTNHQSTIFTTLSQKFDKVLNGLNVSEPRCSQSSQEPNNTPSTNPASISHTRGFINCTDCDKRVQSASAMLTHRYYHHEPQSCQICGKELKNYDTLREHKKLHNHERHSCTECDKKFLTRKYFLKHMKIHNRQPEVPVLEESSVNKAQFTHHLPELPSNQVVGNQPLQNEYTIQQPTLESSEVSFINDYAHPIEYNVPQPLEFGSQMCYQPNPNNYTTEPSELTSVDLIAPVKHTASLAGPSGSFDANGMPMPIAREVYTSVNDNSAFNAQQLIPVVLNSASEESRYPNDVGEFSYQNPSIRNSASDLICQQCNMSFNTKKDLRMHRRSHLKCHICNQGYASLSSLKRHARSCHNEVTSTERVDLENHSTQASIPTVVNQLSFDATQQLSSFEPITWQYSDSNLENFNAAPLNSQPNAFNVETQELSSSLFDTDRWSCGVMYMEASHVPAQASCTVNNDVTNTTQRSQQLFPQSLSDLQ